MSDSPEQLPADLAALGEQLRRNRPELNPLELDRIKMNVMRRPQSAPKGGFMRARLTILSFLVVGLLMMGTGGALAVSGFSGNSAAGSEYGPSGVKGVQANGTLGVKKAPSATKKTTSSTAPAAVAPAATTSQVQPTQQVSSGGRSLPFTGYAAIPILLIGVTLLGTGAMMRRRTRGQE
jgi:hypothetical protein